jgi:hypothetical protein
MERIDYSKLNYEVKVEGGKLAPEPPVVPLRSDEQQKTVEELKQVVADLTALVQQLASSRPA